MTNSETGPSKAHPNVIAIENKNRKLNHEEANAFDKDGDVILSKGGNRNSVGFTPMECYTIAHIIIHQEVFSQKKILYSQYITNLKK